MSDWLDQLVGTWSFEGRSVPDDPVHRRTGTETVSRRGVWTVIESSDGARFQLARNPATGAITGDFVNWEDATLWTYDGAMDAEGRLHLRSRGPASTSRAKPPTTTMCSKSSHPTCADTSGVCWAPTVSGRTL